jgi:hypothetical protein
MREKTTVDGNRMPANASDHRFTIAVIPDSQNYIDYGHQTAEGFPFDARELLFEQMRFIADRTQDAGGDIAFVTAVGDILQHQTLKMDADHIARGFEVMPNPIMDKHFAPTPKVISVEMPAARQAFELIAGATPFSVAPGNHDHDAQWSVAGYPPDPVYNPNNPNSLGMLHVGGLENWTEIFGDQSAFFKDKPWYVASHNGGASSAQIFTAAGYRFLHLGLEFAPTDPVLEWASGVIRANPGLPTIVTVHDFIDAAARRIPNPCVDMRAVDPERNNPHDVWEKFICGNSQIFLVLSGHEPGQAYRADANQTGHTVHQVLANYQHRGQAAIDAGANTRHPAIGDGWLRLMTFDLAEPIPSIRVRTYSTHYKTYSNDHPDYAAWYRRHEQPTLSDDEFLAADDFTILLDDFQARYGARDTVAAA